MTAGSSNIKCIEDGKFYRNPDRPSKKIWANVECAKYFLCVEGEVYEFKCSIGLLFDVQRQICDFKVDNCDITSGTYHSSCTRVNWYTGRATYSIRSSSFDADGLAKSKVVRANSFPVDCPPRAPRMRNVTKSNLTLQFHSIRPVQCDQCIY